MPFWTISLTGGPKRANQAATALGWRIYSFGEFDPQMEESNSDEIFGVHVLNTECYRWYQLLGSSKSSIYLPALLYDKVFKHRLKINQLSGDKNDEKNDYENDSDTDDDINNEERRSALIETPGNRTGHTVVTYEGKIYMWGGFIAQFELCSKLYCFDPEMKTWSVIPCNGETPPGRARHTAVVYNDMMIIYGGREDHFNG
uniref:Uncharacterized protein n=1 Tax=Setaria digitata TaxID=48799 RepID=A0A915Q0U8_9BILA